MNSYRAHYHLQAEQSLMFANNPTTEMFCQWFTQQSADPFFILSVLFTDKATFGRHRIMNFHNQHHWAEVFLMV
jgi:alpha-L-fucosidase